MKNLRRNDFFIFNNSVLNLRRNYKLKYNYSTSKNNVIKKHNEMKKLNLAENKFPSLEENIVNLLNEMETEKETNQTKISKLNRLLIQKDNIIFINNNIQKVDLFRNLTSGDLILINKKYLAKCLALNDKMSTFVIFDKINFSEIEITDIVKLDKEQAIKIDYGDHLNKILNIQGEHIKEKNEKNKLSDDFKHSIFLELNLSHIKNCASLSKKYIERNTVDNMLFTGNLIIDYLSPIYKGNFNVFTGNPNLGQKNTMFYALNNFFNFSKSLNENFFVVYVTYSKKDAILVKDKIEKNFEQAKIKFLDDIKNKNLEEFNIGEIEKNLNQEKYNYNDITSNNKYCIFTLNDNNCDSEFTYLPKVALNFANMILHNSETIFGNKQKLNILFCFDDVTTFALKEKMHYHSSLLYQSSNNFMNELYEHCGNWKNHSFSSLIIFEKNKSNIEYEDYVNKYMNNVFSFTDKRVYFEANINQMKKYIPNLKFDFSGIPNIQVTSPYLLSYQYDFKEILSMIFKAHKKQEEIKKLNIHVDPWDNYLYYDSKFFLEFVMNENFSSPQDKFIQLIFLNFLFQNEFLSNFKKDGKYISNKFMKFLQNGDKSKKIYDFLDDVIYSKYLPSEKEMEDFERNLEVIFDLFISQCSSKQEFSDIKEDYFKI